MSYELTKTILETPLGDHIAQHLLATLATHCEGDKTECWPSVTRLVALTGICRRTVIDKLWWLVENQYLTKKRVNGHNVYHISRLKND